MVGNVGGATLCMMRNLEVERVTLAAMSLGIARRSIEVMSKYAQERKAFGKAIGEFGQVRHRVSARHSPLLFASHHGLCIELLHQHSCCLNHQYAVALLVHQTQKAIAESYAEFMAGRSYVYQVDYYAFTH